MSTIITIQSTDVVANSRADLNANFAALNADKQETSSKDTTGGYVGLTLFKINFRNVLNTFTSFFTNSNTAARTYTFPDKDMTVAGIVDIPTSTTGFTEGTNLYFTTARVLATVIAGYVSASGTVVATDTILQAIQKLNGNDALRETSSNKDASNGYAGLTLLKINFKNVANTFTSFFTNTNTAARTYTFPDKDLTVAGLADIITALITGYVSGAGTVAATDTILQAINKLNGNTALKADIASPTFTGDPLAPTPTITDNDTSISTTAFVQQAISSYRAINAQTGTTYTLVLTDGVNTLCTFSNAAAITATVPPNSSVAFPVGTRIDIEQKGAGKLTLAQGAGVTINSFGGNKALAGQYVSATLVKEATDTWLLTGNLIA